MSTFEISQSSLLSLKAEIFRKQQELSKTKNDNEIKIKVLNKNPLEIKNKGVEARSKADELKEEEDQDLLKKSRSQLEMKSMLYEKLSQGNTTEEQKNINKRFLVRFDKKKPVTTNILCTEFDEADKYPDSEGEYYNSSDDEAVKDPGEKWVEYVDCLGRTRKCLQKDLEYLKSKDGKLREVVEAKKKSKGENLELPVTDNKDDTLNNHKVTEESELLSSDMRRELLREQWEQDEEELRNKSSIHYQDILFGEARTHGVGYYAFSKDEEERLKQQEGLKNIRQETEQKQKRAQELKSLREKQLAARIKAAKDRKRARLGLPPEEDKPESSLQPQISEEEKRKQDEELHKKEVVEKMLEEARKQHVRPWDIGKEGVKEHYEMSQEEWVDKKRSERPGEFAPPTMYTRTAFRSKEKSTDFTEADVEEIVESRKKKSNVLRSKQKQKLQTFLGKKKDMTSLENNHSQVQQREQLDDHDYYEDKLINDYNKIIHNINNRGSSTTTRFFNQDATSNKFSNDRDNRCHGVEIAPPPTFDYYGPGYSKPSKRSFEPNDVEQSIEAGLKFLRKEIEKKPKKYI